MLALQTQQPGSGRLPSLREPSVQVRSWKKGFAKCDIALAKGKQKFDKRATEKERDWNRQKQRLMRQGS